MTFQPIKDRFDLADGLQEFQRRVMNTSKDRHPLQILDEKFQPDLLRNQVAQFKLRAEISLSCILKSGTKLSKTLNILAATMNRKVDLLSKILTKKLDNLGNSISKLDCLQTYDYEQ